jgi:hypothetical protein
MFRTNRQFSLKKDKNFKNIKLTNMEKAKQEAIEEFKRKQESNVFLNVEIPITEHTVVFYVTENTEKDKLKNWINDLILSEISVIKKDNMLLAVELKDKLDAYKKWAILQIEQKAK